MVKKYQEYINELWSKGLNRSKNNDERLGDRLNTNIDELKPVDLGLPFLIADKDLEVDDESLFTWNDLLNLEKHLKSNGWRIPTRNELDCTGGINDPQKIDYMYSPQNKMYLISRTDSKKDLVIKMDYWYGHKFWCIGDEPTEWKIYNGKLIQTSIFSEVGEDNKFHIRLVKDKNMTGSINRNKSDEV